jgi:hypothetical protein
MYWLRSVDFAALGGYGLLSLAWMAGGWGLAAGAFRLRRGERVLSGLALGWVLFMTLANLLAPLVHLPLAYAVAAALILVTGALVAWRSGVGLASLKADLKDWKIHLALLAALVLLAAVFAGIERGLAFFDEDVHLPLVSAMAAGDIPPHFYLNPGQSFAYHYALQVWAASLVQVARFYPWSAWDFSKALAIAFTLVLGGVWAWRWSRSRGVASLGSLILTLGGGARWLLLLLPGGLLAWASSGTTLINTGADTAGSLAEALARPWVTSGAGPVPFPFAFHNGVFVPVIMVLGSTGALPFLTVLLLWLLVPRQKWTPAGIAVIVLLMANLALSAEHLFAFLWAGLALVWIVQVWEAHAETRRRGDVHRVRRAHQPASFQIGSDARGASYAWAWGIILGVSALLSVVQGGFVSELARTLLGKLAGSAAQTNNFWGFGLRWPPAIYSAHLGILSLFNPRQWLPLLAELGPALLLAPLASWFAWRSLRRGDWLAGALSIAAGLNLVFPLFIAYGVDRSITRMPGTALWLWLLLALPPLLVAWRRRPRLGRPLIAAGYAVTLLGGVVMFTIQLTAIPTPQISDYLGPVDAQVTRVFWNKLEPGAQVLDETPYRAVTIFGRESTARSSIYVTLPQYAALVANPDPAAAAKNGFQYIYMAEDWWGKLSPSQQQAFQQPCVNQVGETFTSGTNWRTLYDVGKCGNK